MVLHLRGVFRGIGEYLSRGIHNRHTHLRRFLDAVGNVLKAAAISSVIPCITYLILQHRDHIPHPPFHLFTIIDFAKMGVDQGQTEHPQRRQHDVDKEKFPE